jgi:hypothetical protein
MAGITILMKSYVHLCVVVQVLSSIVRMSVRDMMRKHRNKKS